MNANAFLQKDYENETAFRPKKTNPIKANFRKAKMNLKSLARKSGHTHFCTSRKKSLILLQTANTILTIVIGVDTCSATLEKLLM